MAKVKAKRTPDVSTVDLDAMLDDLLPGAVKRTSDVVGFWDSDKGAPLVCIPRHASVFDSKTFDPTKPSLLLFCEVVKACTILTDDGEVTEARPGEFVGVWAKPGMRDVRNLCGVTCIIARDPRLDQDTGKGNPMKGYAVRSVETGTVIPITEDRRNKSKGSKTFLD